MKKIISIIFCCLFFMGCATSNPKVIGWIGHPMVSDNDKYFPSQGWIPSVQIGLRDDGVVIWKQVDKD